jgi:hypothetical protein
MVLEALQRAGGADYLLRQAKKRNSGPFLGLLAKCLPLQHEHSGRLTLEQLITNSVPADGSV